MSVFGLKEIHYDLSGKFVRNCIWFD